MDPTATPAPFTGNATLDHYLALAGIVVTAASSAAAFLNAKIRAALDAGEEVPRLFLWVGLALNYAAINIDKAGQLQRLLRGQAILVSRVALPPTDKAGAP